MVRCIARKVSHSVYYVSYIILGVPNIDGLITILFEGVWVLLGSTKHICIPFVLTHFHSEFCSFYRPWVLPLHWRIFYINIVCHITHFFLLLFHIELLSN